MSASLAVGEAEVSEQQVVESSPHVSELAGVGFLGVFPKKWRRCLCREFVDVSES